MGIKFIFKSAANKFMRLSTQKILIVLITIFSFCKPVSASDTVLAPVRIAVLAPLYLDSAFTGDNYKLSNTKIPQYFLSGLEFYNGVMMAIDSLQKENANIEVWIYDTHKRGESVQQIAGEMQALNFSMIIASFSSLAEQKFISDFSSKNSIPVISATFPTDADLNYNPFFIMVNPTWKTHIDAIYNYLATNYKDQKIVYFTKNGMLENRIMDELKLLNVNRALNFSTIILNDNFSDADVLKHLDSTKQNLLVCGSLDENFGRTLIKTLNDNGDVYRTVVAGMPTWSGMNEILGNSSAKIQILISSPYNYLQATPLSDNLSEEYKDNYFAKPSDMVFKGYECMYHFTKLLLQHPGDFINNVSDSAYTLFNDYDFEPVRLSTTSFVPDYLENKKIYFIKIVNGEVQSVQ